MAVGLRSGLGDGIYTATYRVISADSHPVSGGFTFTVGAGGAAPSASVADLIDAGGAGTATEIAFGVVRGLCYLAIALVAGGLAFALAVWRGLPGEDRVTAFAGRAGNGAPGGNLATAAPSGRPERRARRESCDRTAGAPCARRAQRNRHPRAAGGDGRSRRRSLRARPSRGERGHSRSSP